MKLVLACQECGWQPKPGLTVGLVKAHFQTEHDTDQIRFDLVAPCTAAMAIVLDGLGLNVRGGAEGAHDLLRMTEGLAR